MLLRGVGLLAVSVSAIPSPDFVASLTESAPSGVNATVVEAGSQESYNSKCGVRRPRLDLIAAGATAKVLTAGSSATGSGQVIDTKKMNHVKAAGSVYGGVTKAVEATEKFGSALLHAINPYLAVKVDQWAEGLEDVRPWVSTSAPSGYALPATRMLRHSR